MASNGVNVNESSSHPRNNSNLNMGDTENAIPANNSAPRPNHSTETVINLDQGDPTMFEHYWKKMGEKCSVTISGCQSLSYFSNMGNLCWFLEPELEDEIKRVHGVVGNAVIDDKHIVVGTGSTQVFQAALYALTSPRGDNEPPVSVVSAAPYYSSFAEITDFLKSGLYKWAGDASTFKEKGPYIEVITSPNNPDGFCRENVVKNGGEGKLIHDLAYYWPQYTPIVRPADHDIMLFTFSKCTGHAGSRLGWALVKDKEVARKMTEFIVLNTIGVSKESQLRASKILGAISDSCHTDSDFFKQGQCRMAQRWEKLRSVVEGIEAFSLPEYPSDYCLFSYKFITSHPGFAWLKCKKETIEDLASFFRGHKILTRNGKRFGFDSNYARISILSKDEEFDLFVERLGAIKEIIGNGNHV